MSGGVERVMLARNFFTLKLNSETQLRRLLIGSEFGARIVVEGILGRIRRLEDFEGTLVRIEFEGGEMSLDASLDDIIRLLKKRGMSRLEEGKPQAGGSLG